MIRSAASRLLTASLHARRATARRSLFVAPLLSTTANNCVSHGSATTSVSVAHPQQQQQQHYRFFSSTPDAANASEVPTQQKEEQIVFDTEKHTFETLENLHPNTKESLAHQGISVMTEIQAKTWHAAVEGQDVIGRARTGSGKTLAFLLPAMERLLRDSNNSQNKYGIKVLIVSPTRELANQISEAAKTVTARHPQLKSQVLYGGVPKRRDMIEFARNKPSILTATPGRLLDHLQSSYVEVDQGVPFAEMVKDVDVLVLDEMDRLLDMGFREDIRSLLSYLPPKESRQTLLFSATVPRSVQEMIDECVRPERVYIDCIQEDDPNSHVVHTVAQSHAIVPQDKLVSGVAQAILHLMDTTEQHKILVFFPTTSQVAYFACLFNRGLGRPVLEIHSRKNQDSRSNTSERFRQARRAVMFTSDVSARGVDYPDVTHVVQVGTASDRETYIHRLGRTGRAGKSGKGVLLMMEEEKPWLHDDLRGIDIPSNDKLQEVINNGTAELEAAMPEIQMRAGFDLEKKAGQAYISLFGFYTQTFRQLKVRGLADRVVEFVNGFAKQAGLQSLPPIRADLAQQLGLGGHPGLNIQDRRGGYSDRRSGGGYGGHGHGRGGGYGRGSYGGHSGGGHGSYGGHSGGGGRGYRGDHHDQHHGGGGRGAAGGWNPYRNRGGDGGGFRRSRDDFERGPPRRNPYDYGDMGDDEGFGRRSSGGRGGRGGRGGGGRGDDGW